MTDPISPAEAATANAIDANLAEHAATPNADLAHDPMAIPHAQHIVPTPQEHHAGDKPVHHIPAVAPQGVVEKPVAPSAVLAEKLASGVKPKKRKYAYQRNRK
jgi:hypothetical protein